MIWPLTSMVTTTLLMIELNIMVPYLPNWYMYNNLNLEVNGRLHAGSASWYTLLYGAPFVTSILLSTEAILSRQKSKMWHLASGYAMCDSSWQKYFCPTKVTFVDKSNFCLDKSTFVQQKLLLSDKRYFRRQKYFCFDKSTFVLMSCIDCRWRTWSIDWLQHLRHIHLVYY